MRPTRGSKYTRREVAALVEGYEELRNRRDTSRRGLHFLVCIADLDQAVRHLSRKRREAVLLHGQVGMTFAESGRRLGVSGGAISARYAAAVDELTDILNGDADAD